MSCMNLPDIGGVWIISKPIRADLELVQSGNAIWGTYHNSEVEGAIEGTLTMDGEDNTPILTGKWADRLGAGDFRVVIGEVASSNRMFFRGDWKHSGSHSWDGSFEGEGHATG